MPQPNLPVVDPNSPLGRRLLGQQQPALPAGLAFGGGDLGGRDTNDPAIQALLRGQDAAARGSGPTAGGPAGPITPEGRPRPDGPPIVAASPTPATLAAGDTAVAPVPTQDPFRILPARPATDRRLSDGSILPGEYFGPGQAGMTGAGFQPGLMQVGGMTTSAQNPADYLIGLQQNARINGVNPQFTAEQFLATLNNGADRSGRAAVAAQGANANLAGQRMQGDAQLGTARIQADAQLAAQAQKGVTDLLGASLAHPGSLTPAFLDMAAPHFQPRPASASPAGQPGSPPSAGGGQPPAAGLPGTPAAAGGQPGVFGAMQANAGNQQFVASLFPALGIGPDGKIPEGHAITPQMANQLLDRLQAGNATDQQRQAVAAAIRARQLGDPQAMRNALLQATAISHFHAQPPVDPRTGKPVDFLNYAGSPDQLPPFAVPGSNGRPLFQLGVGPVSAGSILTNPLSGGVGYNQVTGPNGEVVPIDRYSLRGVIPQLNATPRQTYTQRAGQGGSLLEMLNR